MIDLSSTLFLKGKFEIAAAREDVDLLWCVVRHIRDWMTNKWARKGEAVSRENAVWTKWKFGSTFSSEHDMVRFYSVYACGEEENQICWACKINESFPSQNGCAPRSWTTEVGFQSLEADKASLSIVLYYSDRPGFIGPCEDPVPPSIPNLIRKLCEDRDIACTVDSHPLTLQPVLLKPGDFPAFWQVVSDENREIPVVYISPRRTEEGTQTLIDPQFLANSVLGPNALVYYAEDLDFTREMDQMCRRGYECRGGDIRVYTSHPRVEENDQYRHRILFAREILERGEAGAQQVQEILRRALAQDVYFYNQMFRVEDCKKMQERRAMKLRLEEYRKTVKQSLESEILDSTLENLNVLENRCEELETKLLEEEILVESERAETERAIKDLKQQLHNSRIREEEQRTAAAQAREEILKSVRERFLKYPASAGEIAGVFLTLFPERIDFTERGFASLKECGTDPEILWDAFYQITTTLYDLYDAGDVSVVDKEFNRLCSGLSMARGEGMMTRQDRRLMQQYQDEYRGRTIDVEPHIKTSENRETSKRFLRVYFCFHTYEEESREVMADGVHRKPVKRSKIIISSCGKHLENYSTQKLR